MRSHERRRGLLRAPRLAWEILGRGRYEFVYDRMPMVAAGMPWAKRLNLFRAGANLLHRRTNPWSMPLHMQFELMPGLPGRNAVCTPSAKGHGRGTVRARNGRGWSLRPDCLTVGLG